MCIRVGDGPPTALSHRATRCSLDAHHPLGRAVDHPPRGHGRRWPRSPPLPIVRNFAPDEAGFVGTGRFRGSVPQMDGVHDLGGIDGFGPVEREADEPVFHADWERRVFRVNIAAGMAGRRTAGCSATASSAWIQPTTSRRPTTSIGSRCRRLCSVAAWSRHRPTSTRRGGQFLLSRRDRGVPPDRPQLLIALEPQLRCRRPGARARVAPVWSHPAAPRYVQGKRGVVVRPDGTFSAPDIEAHGGASASIPTYSVRFSTRSSGERWCRKRGGQCRSLGALPRGRRMSAITTTITIPEPLAPVEARVAAMEAVLTERGLFDARQLDESLRIPTDLGR